MRYLILLLLALPAYGQFGAAKQVVNGNGAPNAAQCASANNVGLVYARKNGEAAYSTFYVCSNTAAATYEWELMGAGGGGGGVSSVAATGGVQTASGSAITTTGTVRGAFIANAQTGTTYTVLTGDRGKVITLSNAAAIAVTLPQAGSGFEDGWFAIVKNIGAGDVTITPTTSTISGAASIVLSLGEFALITSNGTNYEAESTRITVDSALAITRSRTGQLIGIGPTIVTLTGAQVLTDKEIIASSNSIGPAAIKDNCSDAGANDTYACSISPAITAYVTGNHYRFKANTANTGAATINFNTLGAKTIVKVAGGITTALADNDIRVGQWVDLVYDGTNMQMQSLLGNAPGGSGTVTSVGFTGGLISVADPTTTPAFTVAGTSGGIPYFSAASTWASSAALAANKGVFGGGAGAAPTTNANFTASIGDFTMGTAGSVVGTLAFANATSGTIKFSPTTGALGSTVLTLPATTGNIPSIAGALAVASGKTMTASNTLTFTGTDSSSVAFGTGGTVAYTIFAGTKALDTDAIASGACDTLATTTATGAASTDIVTFTANADITGVTGYAPVTTGGLAIYVWPTTNTINYKVCNPTSSSITPGAVTLNVRITR
jgi:hypothetical protein